MTVAQSLTAIVLLLEYQRIVATKVNWRNNIVVVITHVDGILKSQIKVQTFHTSRLFLLTNFFQYTSNWSEAS